MVVFVLVFLILFVYVLYLSFFQEKFIGGIVFVGLDNYVCVFIDLQFWEVFGCVFVFLVVQVLIMLIFVFGVVFVFDSVCLCGVFFFCILIFLFYVVFVVVVVFMWGYIYGDQFGFMSNINDFFGVDVIMFFVKEWMLFLIGNIVMWEFVGYNMLIFYFLFKMILSDMYEVVLLDGVGVWCIVFLIKIFFVCGVFVIVIIFLIIGSFQLFNEFNILCLFVLNVIMMFFILNMYVYNLLFVGQQFNYVVIIVIIMGVIIVVIVYVVQLCGLKLEVC